MVAILERGRPVADEETERARLSDRWVRRNVPAVRILEKVEDVTPARALVFGDGRRQERSGEVRTCQRSGPLGEEPVKPPGCDGASPEGFVTDELQEEGPVRSPAVNGNREAKQGLPRAVRALPPGWHPSR